VILCLDKEKGMNITMRIIGFYKEICRMEFQHSFTIEGYYKLESANKGD